MSNRVYRRLCRHARLGHKSPFRCQECGRPTGKHATVTPLYVYACPRCAHRAC